MGEKNLGTKTGIGAQTLRGRRTGGCIGVAGCVYDGMGAGGWLGGRELTCAVYTVASTARVPY